MKEDDDINLNNDDENIIDDINNNYNNNNNIISNNNEEEDNIYNNSDTNIKILHNYYKDLAFNGLPNNLTYKEKMNYEEQRLDNEINKLKIYLSKEKNKINEIDSLLDNYNKNN